MQRLFSGLALALAVGWPLAASASRAVLLPPRGFVAYPQHDASIHAWAKPSKFGPPATLSVTEHPYAGTLAGFVRERLVVGAARTPSLALVLQRDVRLCGRSGTFLETTYVVADVRYHAESVMGLGTKIGYAANYVRADGVPEDEAAIAALLAFCITP